MADGKSNYYPLGAPITQFVKPISAEDMLNHRQTVLYVLQEIHSQQGTSAQNLVKEAEMLLKWMLKEFDR